MIDYLSYLDTQVFLFFNGMHSSFWDYFMSAFTGKIIWGGMYASILFVLFRNYHWKKALCYVVVVALCITFADQVCGSIIRPVIARLRPSNLENPLAEWVHIVNGKRGGSYGFPSCHASNSFALAAYVMCLFRKRWLSVFIVLWALCNCYTRLYLGVHYPGDLLVGAIIGGVGAWGICALAHKLLIRFDIPTEPKVGSSQQRISQPITIAYVGILTIVGILIYAAVQSC